MFRQILKPARETKKYRLQQCPTEQTCGRMSQTREFSEMSFYDSIIGKLCPLLTLFDKTFLRKLKLLDLRHKSVEQQHTYFCSPRISIVTIPLSLLRSTVDYLKPASHMFLYREIVKVLKCKTELIFEIRAPKYLQILAKSVKGFRSYG